MAENKELKRQVFHFFLGILIFVLVRNDVLNLISLFVILLIGIVISFISKKINILGVKWWLEHFDRKNAPIPGYGVITYFLGVIIVLALFNEKIALASVMILAFGDSFCHLGRFGKINNPFNKAKFLEGTIIGIIMGTIGAGFFVSWTVAFFGSLAAMSIEGIELAVLKKKIDDNLLIPIISALIMALF